MADSFPVFVNAVGRTLGLTLNAPVKASEASVGAFAGGEVVAGAMIRFENSRVAYELLLAGSDEAFQVIVNQIGGGRAGDDTLESELLAEVLNIAFGQADPQLAANGVKLRSSFPVKVSREEWASFAKKIPATCSRADFQIYGKKLAFGIFPAESFSSKWNYSAPVPRE